MKKHWFLSIAAMCLLGSALTGCGPAATGPATPTVVTERNAAVEAVRGSSTICAECENIKFKRVTLDQPGVIGYVAFLSENGQPVLYTTTSGKCTSSGKRLENNYEIAHDLNGDHTFFFADAEKTPIVQGAGEDGTYGSSDSYVYCKTTDNAYIQWNGPYLWSNRPIQLTIKPMAVTQVQDVNAVHGQ